MLSRRKPIDSYLTSLQMFLGTSEGITQPPSHTFYRGYLPIPSKVNQKQPSGVPMYEPQMSKRLKATLTILTIWGDSHNPSSYVCVGQQISKPCLRQNPRCTKTLVYDLIRNQRVISLLQVSTWPRVELPFESKFPDIINIEKGLPIDWPTTSKFKHLWGFYTSYPTSLA